MPTPLATTLGTLRRQFGGGEPPPVEGPLGLVLWENIGYLADDERRAAAYRMLQQRVGIDADRILAAPLALLTEIASAGGIHGPLRARRLQEIAAIVRDEFGGDLSSALTLPFREARRALMKFPSIGEPGAEKILLFSGAHPVLSLDSNALRVLQRLGYGEEKKSYTATYRSVRDAAAAELPAKVTALRDAYLLLRRHGQTVCKSSTPLCEACPLASTCAYYQRVHTAPL